MATETMTMAAPSADEALEARRRTIHTTVLGAVSWPLVGAVAWWLWPATTARTDRMGVVLLALQLCIVPATLLAALVNSCIRTHEKNPAALNPFAGVESDRWKLNARALQNTLEQAAIFVPAILALSARLDPAQAKALPILTLLWCAGRLMFWFALHVDLAWRGPGFNWTFASSSAAIVWFAATLF